MNEKKLLVKSMLDAYYGEIGGLFITTQSEIDKVIGKSFWLHEVAGKHSEFNINLESVTLKSC